jgi:hypothetical protein
MASNTYSDNNQSAKAALARIRAKNLAAKAAPTPAPKAAAPKATAPKAAAATPKPAPKAAPNPFADPNYALSQLNAYFGGLRKDYGEDAIRAAGFTPRDLSAMQASLRKLQMDPRATPEQHQQAFNQARDALAQRVTTPLTAARKPVAPQMPVPMVGNGDFRPTAAQLAEYNAGRIKGQWNSDTGVFENPFVPPPTDTREVSGYRTPAPGVRGGDTRIFADQPPAAPRPQIEVRPEVMPIPVTPPLPADYPADLRAPGGGIPSVIFTGEGYKPNPAYTADVAMQRYRAELPNNNYYSPEERQQIMSSIESAYAQPGATGKQVSDAYQNASFAATRARPKVGPAAPVPSASDYIANGVPPMQSTPMPPTGPFISPGTMQQQPAAPSMNTQPGADFDRNVGRQIFDSEFRTLREKYGDEGLRAAGLTPRTLASLQAPLTNVQRDNTITYDQSSAALENALKQLRGYNFGGAQPAAPMQPAAPAPLPAGAQQSPIPGYYRGGFAQRYR